MKKRTLLLAMTLSAALLLVGCSQNNNSEVERLKAEISRLEQQVTDLKNQKETASTDTQQNNNTDDTKLPYEVSTNAELLSFDELTALVTAFEEKAAAVESSTDQAENTKRFHELEKEAEDIERKLDVYEDNLKQKYFEGSLTKEEFHALDVEEEKLDDTLDRIEDELESRLGVND